MLGEYDAGYENYIDSLIQEIEKLQDENDKLSEQVISCIEAENAKLQDELEFANNQCERAILELLDQQGQLEADNAKLRELVRWMYDRMDESCAVQHPYAPAPISYDRLMQAATRAHELGVEVDDGSR